MISSSSSTDKVQNNDTSSRPTTANVKNPLLSAAVTGLTFDDFTHNAVLLPAANVVVPVVPPTHNQSFQGPPTTGPTIGYYKNQDNDDMKEKYKVKSIVFGGQESNVAAILDTESFSEINLNQPTEITAQSSSSSSLNRGDLRRSDYNPLENLDENLLTEDPQQQHQTNTKLESAFSPLLQQTTSLTAQLSQLPSVASSVLSSFSNILRGGTLSPTSNVTANEPDIDQEDQVVSGSNIPYLNDISSLNYHQNFIGGSAINEQQQQQPSSVIEPPTFYSPTDSVFIGSKLPPPSSSAVTAQGSSIQSDNHYRISAKKKIYAAVPGLNATTTTGQNLPPPPLPINSSLPPPTINSSLPPPPPPSIISETGNYFNNNQIPPPIQPVVNSTISLPLPSQPLELPGNSSNYFTDTLGSNQQQQQQQQYQSLPPQPQPQPTTTINNNNKFSLTSFFQTPLVNKLQSTINQNFGNFTEPYVKQQSENPNDEIFSISTITSDGGIIIPHGITTGYQQQQHHQQPTAPPPPPINPPSLINPNLFKTKIQSITTQQQQQQTPINNNNEFNPINSPPTLELNAPPATITGSVPINFYQQNTSSIPVAAAAAAASVPFVNNPQHQHQATTVDPQQIVANFNQFSSPIEQISLNSKLPQPQPQPPPLPLPPPPADVAKIVGSPPNSGLKNNYRLNKRIPLYKSNLTPSSSSSVPVQPQLNVHQPTLSFEQTLLPNVIDQSSSSIITHPITQILNPELQIVTNNNIPKSSGQINLDNQPSKIINPSSSSSSSSIITNVPNLFVPNIENQLQPSVDVNKIIPDQAQQGGNISQSYQVPTHSDVLFYDSSTPSINQRPFTGEILQQPQQIESFPLPINDELSTESFAKTLNTSIDKILLDDNCLPPSQSQQKNHIIPNVGERCIVYGNDTESKDTGFYFDSHTLPSTTINTKVPLLPEEKQSLNFFDIQKPITTNIQQETDQVNNKQLITNWFNQQQPSEQSLQQPQSSQQQQQQQQQQQPQQIQSTGIHRESSTATPFQPIEIFPLTSTSTSTPSITTEKPILLNPIITTAPIDPINFFNNQLLLQSTTTSIDPSSTNLITTDNNNTITTATTESIGQQQQQQQEELLIDNQQSILQNIFNNQPQSQPQPQPTQPTPSELNELNIINKRLQNIQLFNSSSGVGGLGDNTNLSFVTPSESYSFASNLVEPPSSTQSEFSELADLSLADRTLTQINDDDECSTANNEQLSVQLQIDAQKYFDRIDAIEYQRSNNKIYDQIKTNMEESPNTANEILLSNEEVVGGGSVTTSAMGNNTIQSGGGGGGIYRPIYKHWFYEKKIIDLKSIWLPFSMVDSMNLEEAFIKQDKETIETDGGRFDVNISLRQKTSIYWNEKPNAVRRCSWFYKGSNLRYIPYEEDIADKLESEYQNAFTTAEWNRTILLENGEKVVFHGASVMVHFLNYQLAADATNADWSVPSGPIPDRPRIVKRGFDEFNIDDGEPEQVDHLLFMVHGIGAACDLKFRSVEEVVDEFRCNAMQLVQSHYRCASDNGAVGRIEVLPISWHGELHSTESGIDEKLKAITLESIPKLRSFTNDTLLDVLFYTSPVFCQQIMDSVSGSLNRLYRKYCERNPTFHGDVSLAGHSLGSLILFDLLQHQTITPTTSTTIQDPINNIKINTEEMQQKVSDSNNKCIRGTAGTGQPSIEYPNLIFKPKNFFALGSPIGMFVTIRGIDGLGPDFKLPTTDGFYNIFHPYDPVAYRIEALINSDLSALRPVLIGHHKGRKRMHLELRETMTRVGSDIKQKIVDTFRHTLDKVYSFRMNNRAGVTKAIEQEVDKALEEQLNLDSKEVGTINASSTSSSSSPLPPQPPTMGGEFDGETDLPLGILNQGKRIDYVLQEAPLEFFNEYLFALTSHVCYWESEDTTLFIIKEIYSSLGIQTDSTIINTADN